MSACIGGRGVSIRTRLQNARKAPLGKGNRFYYLKFMHYNLMKQYTNICENFQFQFL